MNTLRASTFALPDRLAHKADPALLAADDRHLTDVTATLARTVATLTDRLDRTRRQKGREGTGALERDEEVHRLTARLRTLNRLGLDLCLGRMVPVDGDPVYVGRLGLTDDDGRRLLVDWRSPAAAPFFAATPADPMGLASRRRYRWTRGRVTDYWDEVLTPGTDSTDLAPDTDSDFLAGLGHSRSPRMRDVLATIATDQDAAVRASARGALVVDGGPGTGKTVVALHRAAYLLYADPRIGREHSGGVLVVGPHEPYLAYVADVLPGLGEDEVLTCTVKDLVPEGATAPPEADPAVARLKATARVTEVVDAAVRFHESAPTTPLTVAAPWGDVRIRVRDWTEAVDALEPGTPHNEARGPILDALAERLAEGYDALDDDAPTEEDLAAVLHRDRVVVRTLEASWPLLEATDVVGDLWTVPAYLRHCAPWLEKTDVRAMQRTDAKAWTVSDLPFLDAARLRLGDSGAERRDRARADAEAASRAEMSTVVDHLIAADDSELLLMTMLRGEDMRTSLVDESGLPTRDPDRLAGPFAHVVVDEAQELTDAEWQMVLARCPSRSITVVGDRAQARQGFPEPWTERLARVGVDHARVAGLTVNYRTPEEVMAEAAPVIRAVLPDANVPTSIRAGGEPVGHGAVTELHALLEDWLATEPDGIACAIGVPAPTDVPDDPRVRALTPALAKGLEFDLVVLVDPASFGDGVAGGVDRYVAMTRATRRLVLLDAT